MPKAQKHTCPASLTVEAALILPLFLSAMLVMGGLTQMLVIHFTIGSALQNAGEKIALYTKAAELISKETSVSEELAGAESVLSFAYAEGVVRSSLSENTLIKETVLESGYFSLARSQILSDNQTIDLIADYHVQLPFTGLFTAAATFQQRARVHAWVGYRQEEASEDAEEDETMVYITPHGVVYHRSLDCTYIKPSVSTVSGGSLANKRSQDGSVYYPCEICDPPHSPVGIGTYYITVYGNRYHSSNTCRGIYHDVEEVPLSEVGGRSPCSKCGQ